MKIAMVTIFVSMFMLGCASKSDLEEVRNIAVQANNTATGAAQCCELAHSKIDRMYTKVMSK